MQYTSVDAQQHEREPKVRALKYVSFLIQILMTSLLPTNMTHQFCFEWLIMGTYSVFNGKKLF